MSAPDREVLISTIETSIARHQEVLLQRVEVCLTEHRLQLESAFHRHWLQPNPNRRGSDDHNHGREPHLLPSNFSEDSTLNASNNFTPANGAETFDANGQSHASEAVTARQSEGTQRSRRRNGRGSISSLQEFEERYSTQLQGGAPAMRSEGEADTRLTDKLKPRRAATFSQAVEVNPIAILRKSWDSSLGPKHAAKALINSAWFDMVCGLLIMLNAFLIGAEIEYQATHNGETSETISNLQTVFGVIFLLELLLRLFAAGRSFFDIDQLKWNLFDICLVATFMIDFMLGMIPSAQGIGRLLRTVRFLRILRTLRLVRVTAYAREFRKMAYALQHSTHTLLWAIILLVFVMYCFATTFTQAASDFLKDEQDNMDPEVVGLREAYGTLPRSFYTLYQAISDGKSWGLCLEPLSQVHWFFVALFIFFITLTLFGVMNVLTSVFVDSALQSTEKYKDIKIQEAMLRKKMHVEHLQAVFTDLDVDCSGEISAEEMHFLLNDASLCSYLESIDIFTEDAMTLFNLLDRDDSGFVSIEEFCLGCLRLKGDAKSFDIHCLIYEVERLLAKFTDLMTNIDSGFQEVKLLKKILANQNAMLHKAHSMMAPGLTRGGEDEEEERKETEVFDV